MPCERFREAIASHAAGADLSAAAAAHLGPCEACTARLETQRRLLADVDAELARALSLSASSTFVADVVSQTSSRDERPAPWQSSATWIGLGAAAAIAVAVFVRAPGPPPSPAAAPQQLAATSPAPPVPGHEVVTEHRLPPVEHRRPAARRPPRSSAPAPVARQADEPPVIVQPNQARAIARLRELLIERRLTETMLPPVQPHETGELTVAPLEIPDIIVPDVESVGRAQDLARERQ
jgi:hypothetical protein